MTLPNNVLQLLRNEVDDIRNNFINTPKLNSTLSGHIKKEYALSDTKELISSIAYQMANNYLQTYPQFRDSNDLLFPGTKCDLEVAQPWVNFQQKYEFNPIHKHSGVLSFVIWLDIPFLIEDERKCFPDVSEQNNVTACFGFHYIDVLGNITNCTIPTDKTLNGTMIMFPAKLNHSVNPFYTSDEYRITISGNLHYK